MGEYQRQKKVKLFCGILYVDESIFIKAKKILEDKFSNIDYISDKIPFSYTSYYVPEMGDNINRIYISFSRLVYPYQLAQIKMETNEIEHVFMENFKRKINIDPGYISLSNLVLATTKNYSHRVALSPEIYAEVTLIYKNKQFKPLEWTYPDYKDPVNILSFNKIRDLLIKEIQREEKDSNLF